ncbi:MAG: FHA domain-containing protein [Candidatus Aureabacteria bacterium]|nr:FHA domain-containing protein [Candidatus Auribacterota bacterium]
MTGKITFLNGVHQGKSFYFKNVINIGRNPSNDVELPFPSVSREHSRITHNDGVYQVRDLKSNNGTFVNGKIVADRTEVFNGDIIKIASFDIKFEIVDDNSVDPKNIKSEIKAQISPQRSTETGFVDLNNLNLADLEKHIRE